MKQITFKKAFAIIFICALCASYFLLKEGKQNFTDLTFSNIEALASGESGSGDCYGAEMCIRDRHCPWLVFMG